MNRLHQGIVAVSLGALLLGAGVTAQATSSDPCQKLYTSNTIANLQKYTDCRMDRIEAKVDKLGPSAPSPEPSSPAPTVTPTSPAPSSPAPTTPAPTDPPAAGVCDPAKAAFTFTGQGSRGIDSNYDASAEQWGVTGYNYKSTMGVCNHDSWYVDVTTDNVKGDGAVKAYPSMRRIYHDWSTSDFSKDPRLSSFPQLKVDFAATDPASCAGCIYDTAFDIWLNGIGGSNNTELMVWTHNVGQRPYGSKVASGISLGGHTWDLWSGNSDHYIAYVPTDTANIPAGTLDVKAFVGDLIARNRMAATSLAGGQTDPYVGQVSYGVEPVSTGAVSRHWDFTKFTINES